MVSLIDLQQFGRCLSNKHQFASSDDQNDVFADERHNSCSNAINADFGQNHANMSKHDFDDEHANSLFGCNNFKLDVSLHFKRIFAVNHANKR